MKKYKVAQRHRRIKSNITQNNKKRRDTLKLFSHGINVTLTPKI